MQSASKHERALSILGHTQALWKLALEHSSRRKRHPGPNENVSSTHSSPPAHDLPLLSFAWFGITFSPSAQSPQGPDAPLLSSFLPLPGWDEGPCSLFLSTLHPSVGFGHMECSALRQQSLLSADVPIVAFLCCCCGVWNVHCCGLRTAKADWGMHPHCWSICFWANQNLENWVRKGCLALKLMLLGTGAKIWGGKEVKGRKTIPKHLFQNPVFHNDPQIRSQSIQCLPFMKRNGRLPLHQWWKLQVGAGYLHVNEYLKWPPTLHAKTFLSTCLCARNVDRCYKWIRHLGSE